MEEIKILVLDDEEDIAETTCDAVQDFGFSCVYKTDSKSALTHMRIENVHIIILDIVLDEDVTGIELISQFKALNPAVVVIMLTGEYKIKSAIKAMREGAFDYILKPLDFEFLEERLNLAVNKVKAEALSQVYFNTIVHDLKNPVANLTLLTGALRRMSYYENDDKFRKLIHIGEQSVQSINKMVGNILNVEKFSGGQGKAVKNPFNVWECVEEILQIFRPVVSDELDQIKINFNIPEEFEVHNDQNLYTHVLYNLVANGQRYSDPTDPLIIDISLEGKFLKTSVKNSGSYIEERYRENIFDKFVQIDNGRNTCKNFGLGLTFCKLATSYMEGRIWVDSDREKNETIFNYTVSVE